MAVSVSTPTLNGNTRQADNNVIASTSRDINNIIITGYETHGKVPNTCMMTMSDSARPAIPN